MEEDEGFEEESGMKPGMVSKIRDQLSGTGLSGSVMSQGEYYKLLGETMKDRDEALEKLDSMTKKEKKDQRKKEKRKKKKEEKRVKTSNSQDDEEEMEEEEEK